MRSYRKNIKEHDQKNQYRTDLLKILESLDPAVLTYQEWINVGMGLKESGYTYQDWDNWSKRDSGRYHSGECEKKWITFCWKRNSGNRRNYCANGTGVRLDAGRLWT